MKRTKLMAGTLVLATALLGTGYAAWADALQVNATVSTGSLDVQFGEIKDAKITGTGTDQVGKEDLRTGLTENKDTGKKVVQVTKENEGDNAAGLTKGERDILTLDFSNLHPGATITVPVPIVNLSTVPVELADVDVKGDTGVTGIIAEVQLAGGASVKGNGEDLDKLTQQAMSGAELEVGATKILTYKFTAGQTNVSQNLTTEATTVTFDWQQSEGSKDDDVVAETN